jgi:catenin alpha
MSLDFGCVILQVANLACSMSGNEDGVKMVRYAAAQIENLCPQVINAARILAARPRSKVAQENMDVFRDAWENQVRILTEAVDDITTIDDFLAVSGMVLCRAVIVERFVPHNARKTLKKY